MTEISNRYKTAQEEFWAGSFGTEYIGRNSAESQTLASTTAFFSRILASTSDITSLVEFGANIGLNLEAILRILPHAAMTALEINSDACAELKRRVPAVRVVNESILESVFTDSFDLVLIKGVLIHINPDELNSVYEKLAAASSRYVIIAEYYNPTPVAISYRGHGDRLFKRDFASEFLDRHPEFKLRDYGFVWRRDPVFPQDDITWFLLEK